MSVKDRAQPEGIREVPHARGVLRGGVQHIRGKIMFQPESWFQGDAGVFRQKKGKIFPFWTPFLLRYNYLDFFSWEYHEIKKNRPGKMHRAQTFVVIASCDESLCRYIFRGFPLTFTPLAWKRGRAVSVDASVISVSFPELPYPFLSCTAYLAFCPANVGHRSEKQD